jgi:hypothetical protein
MSLAFFIPACATGGDVVFAPADVEKPAETPTETPENPPEETPENPEPPVEVPVLPDVCAGVAGIIGGTATRHCNAGETQPAWCVGAGLVGHRKCEDGTYLGITEGCPEGSEGINQEGDTLVIAGWLQANHPDFPWLINSTMANGGGAPVVLTIGEVMRAFPSQDVPHSIRLAEQHFDREFAPGLNHLITVGLPDSSKKGTMATDITYTWEIPEWYQPVPPHAKAADSRYQSEMPQTLPYESISGEWHGWDDLLATPKVGRVKVTTFAFDGSVYCETDGTCLSDMAAQAKKQDAWRQNGTGTAPFIHSRFDGHACDGASWGGPTYVNLNGVTQTVISHDCSDGVSGNAWDIAKADAAKLGGVAKYYDYHTHGGEYGASNYDPTLEHGFAYALPGMSFPGLVVGDSCSTGASDYAWRWSLGGSITGSAKGPIAYVGAERWWVNTRSQGLADEMFIRGDFRIGDMMRTFKRNLMKDGLTDRISYRTIQSLRLFGAANLRMAADPTMSVRAQTTRQNGDGSVDTCVDIAAPAGTVSKLMVGGRQVEDLKLDGGWARLAVHLTAAEVARKDIISLSACDPLVTTCQAARPDVLPELELDCSELFDNGDGTYDVDVTSRHRGLQGVGLKAVFTAITLTCEDGLSSDCYADNAEYARGKVEISSEEINRFKAGTNRYSFSLDNLVIPSGAKFRALKFALVDGNKAEHGMCLVRVPFFQAVNIGLL